MKAHLSRVILIVLAIATNLGLPSAASADDRVVLQVKIDPAYPVIDQDIHVVALATDTQGRLLNRAQIVATAWMDRNENPGMPEMNEIGASRSTPLRMAALPQKDAGVYLVTGALPMSGRWRMKVWANSTGFTGKTDLELNVISEPPPEQTNWTVLTIFLALISCALAIILRLKRSAGLQPGGEQRWNSNGSNPSSLPQAPTIRPTHLQHGAKAAHYLRSRWYPAIIQVPIFAFFVVALFFLLAGPANAHDNLGSALVWIAWWPLLPLIFLILGRFWCAVCPMSGLSDLLQRFVGRHRAVPPFLKRRGAWLVLGAFLLITWLDSVLRIVESPTKTAYLLLFVTGGVVLCGILFERRAWCRYLCFIGGMSSNYAMSSILELRGDPEICRHCRSFECARGSERVAGCPMSEFPRTMASNRHCNLCGNCVKSCFKDALRVRLRVPGEELWGLQRRHWVEAILAAALLGIVVIQTTVMLDIWEGFQNLLRGLGIRDFSVAVTVAFLGALVLSMAALGMTGILSSMVSGKSPRHEMIRYAYALIPLGLAAHLAHNLYHLLGEALFIQKDVLALLHTPLNVHPSLVSTSTIQILQYLVVIFGASASVLISVRLGKQGMAENGGQASGATPANGTRRRSLAAVPSVLLVLTVMLTLLTMFSQGMAPRMQMSAHAHDDIEPAQIEVAKESVRDFVGKNIALSYVHLEEHGFRDIILKSGQDYYFVDSDNYLVVSTFSDKTPISSNYRITRDDAERIAFDFASKHYPFFNANSLQPEEEPEEASSFIGGYTFKWRQYVDGVPTPNAVKIMTDDIGRVGVYSARDVKISVPTTPEIPRQKALEIARQMVNYEPSNESAALDIGVDFTGRQMLRWTVRLEGGLGVEDSLIDHRTEIVVDALSGEVSSLLEQS